MGADGVQSFNGGYGNQSVGPQLNDFDLTRIAVREAKKDMVFSQMSQVTKLKRNMGDTFKKMRKFPVLHKDNINDQGIDADGLTMVYDKWYSWDAAGTRQEHATKAAALARVGQVRIQSGQGNLFGGSRDFYEQVGAIPELREEGGVVNVVGAKRTIISAKIKLYSISEMFSRQEMELGGEANLKVEKSAELGRAFSELREAMVRNDLITQGLTNAVYAGAATAMDEVDETSLITYNTIRKFQTKQDLLRVPFDAKMVTGTTRIGTKVVNAARYLYIPLELERSFESMTHNGKEVFKEFAEYAAGNGSTDTHRDVNANYASGEIGSVGKFRIISNYDMPIFRAAGADATDGADADGSGIEDAGEEFSITDGKYDVFPVLSVGSQSFEILGLTGDDMAVKYGAPKIVPGLDNTGETAVVSVRFYYGMLFNKPEQISCILTSGLAS